MPRPADLATRTAWERSRLSHHLERMSGRGLVERTPSESDRRATDAVLTDAGLAARQHQHRLPGLQTDG
ncbi:MarR family protein [Geodermatophilus amargosae]|uniref:MarR family protein n=2 Tax=Geodermatophilus amargosae TaxID=1296565 RepID=A0A1I6ZK04_9ACTN|nr:MarR family protein [Geodermatophilus amargosae]